MPERLFLRLLFIRAALFWAGVRCIFYFVGLAANQPRQGGLVLRPDVAALFALIVGLLGTLEARRRNEDRFLANLGVPLGTIFGLSMAPAVIAEVAVHFAPLR